jgi:hypothetical protein
MFNQQKAELKKSIMATYEAKLQEWKIEHKKETERWS